MTTLVSRTSERKKERFKKAWIEKPRHSPLLPVKACLLSLFCLALSACFYGDNKDSTNSTPSPTVPTALPNPPEPIVQELEPEQPEIVETVVDTTPEPPPEIEPAPEPPEPPTEPSSDPALVITSVGPTCAKPSEAVTIIGQGLSQVSAITVADLPAVVTTMTEEQLTFTIPSEIAEGFTTIVVQGAGENRYPSLFSVGCPKTLAVKEEVGSKVLEVVPKSGGTITTSNANGDITYALEIPEGALSEDTQIGVTPLTQVAGLPFEKGALFAAKFEPDGLQFPTPLTFRVTLPSAPSEPEPLIGFQFSGPDNSWTLTPVSVEGNTLVFSISHFSGAGASVVSRENFVTAVDAIVSSLTILPVSQLGDLSNAFNGFVQHFPDLCESPDGIETCRKVLKIGEDSIAAGLAQFCPEDLKGPLPSVLETTADQVIQIEASAQLMDIFAGNAFACAEEIYLRVLKQKIEELINLPSVERFDRVHGLKIKMFRRGFSDLANLANAGLVDGMKSLLDFVEGSCPSDVKQAMSFAAVAEAVFLNDVVFSPELEVHLNELYEKCGAIIVVNPTSVSITPGSSVTFTADVLHLEPSTVLWNVSASDRSGFISAEGVFTAGSKGGVYTVTAQSFAAPSEVGTATVTVEDILQVAVSPLFVVELKPGETQQFFGNVDSIGPIATDVTWTATGGTVTEDGLYTAGFDLGDSFEEIKEDSHFFRWLWER